MARVTPFLLLLFFWCLSTPFVFAKGSLDSQPESQTELQAETLSESLPESLSETRAETEVPMGSILFSLAGQKFDPENNSVHVGPQDEVNFCVKLNDEDPRLSRALRFLRRIEVTLEREETGQRVVVKTPFRSHVVRPDSSGCYAGKFQVSNTAFSGKYQVTELDLWSVSNRSLPLRAHLGSFSSVGGIEIEGTQTDETPPLLQKITSETHEANHFRLGGHRALALMLFRVYATDEGGGVKPSSLSIFFKAYLDHALIDIVAAECDNGLPNTFYNCKLSYSRPAPELAGRKMQFILDSVSVVDQSGNEVLLSQPQDLEALFDGKVLTYSFSYYRSKHDKPEPQDKLIEWPSTL